ncbi:hypothetical protein VULLAG_LOCUS19936 [Vulpes lagopus]
MDCYYMPCFLSSSHSAFWQRCRSLLGRAAAGL